MAAADPKRILGLAGAHNLRDIGGYLTHDGRMTAWGRVYRSGTLSELDAEALDGLSALGLRVVCDLRSTPERNRKPSRLPDGRDCEVLIRDYDMSTANLTAAVTRPGVTPGNAREMMAGFYRELAYEQADSYRELFARLASGRTPLLFHCAAGKDRTGIAAAILLDLLGVPRETVLDDYALTDNFFERGCELFRENRKHHALAAAEDAIWMPLMRADPDYLVAMFASIEDRHGSARAFVEEHLGIGAAGVEAIRAHLLESG